MEVTVAGEEASTVVEAVVASTAAVVFQAAITGEGTAPAAIAAGGMVTAVAGTEVGRAAVTAEEVMAEQEAGPRKAEVHATRRQDGTRLEDLRRENSRLQDQGLEDQGLVGALVPVSERQLLTGSGIRSEGAAVGLIEARALGVDLAGAAASVDAVFGVIVASAGDAGVVVGGSASAGASVGILSGIGHRTGITRGGNTIFILTRSTH